MGTMGVYRNIKRLLKVRTNKADKSNAESEHRYFSSNAPAYHPGYYVGHEHIHRLQDHKCNSACVIDDLRHWIQSPKSGSPISRKGQT